MHCVMAKSSKCVHALSIAHTRAVVFLHEHPWLDWAFVYLCGGIYCFALRMKNLSVFVDVYGDADNNSMSLQATGVFLGMLEDFCVMTYLVFALWIYDWVSFRLSSWMEIREVRQILEEGSVHGPQQNQACGSATRPRLTSHLKAAARVGLRFVVFFSLFTGSIAFFCADFVLFRSRKLRFTIDWITMYLNDDGAASTVEIPAEEVRLAVTSAVTCGLVSFAFALINVAYKTDLSRWSPIELVPAILRYQRSSKKEVNSTTHSESKSSTGIITTPQGKRASIYYIVMDSEGVIIDEDHPPRNSSIDMLQINGHAVTHGDRDSTGRRFTLPTSALLANKHRQRLSLLVTLVWVIVTAGFCLVVLPIVTMKLAQHTEPLVAQIGLNTDLNELFRSITDKELFVPTVASADITTSTVNSLYIHNATENFTLFGDEGLYRKTHGFYGEKTFNVSVDPENLPNVLILTIESFRHRDSKYLVGEEGAYLMGGNTNLTVTPNFDRWAQRGVAFDNFWSSYRTSRSLESIQFAQLPYDSVTDSGTTGGKPDVALSGLPQLFSALGYDTLYASGCRVDYDQWDSFLPSHGFDTVLAMDEFKAFAESDLGIQPQDWLGDDEGGERRAHSYWGVHDDLSFEVLGNLMINMTKEQQDRVAAGSPKRPTYTTFYSITSHVPYWEHPKWWDDYEDKPDFSALYADATEYSDDIHRYADLRYFEDLAFGKFLDRMEEEGILNDTIVFIVGDHGQAPENGCDKYIEDAQESTTHVAAAMIAEGRLGDAAGTIFKDAAQHYDLLNTLADIVRVPEDGFVQSGVGRSLLRVSPFGERIVWSNNPAKKFAAIRGTTRIEYDRESSAMSVYETRTDHNEQNDLYPSLSDEEKTELDHIRDAGRQLNMYFKERWEGKCILAAEC